MPTIRDVARQAGVSVGTVSKVLSGAANVGEHLRKRVHAAVETLEYQPDFFARSLKTGQSKTIGAVISDITNPFFPLLIRGAEDVAIED